MVCGSFREDIPCELLWICTLVCVNKNFQMKVKSISVYQARYITYIVDKYLDTSRIQIGTTFYKTNLPSDMISAKADAYTTDE